MVNLFPAAYSIANGDDTAQIQRAFDEVTDAVYFAPGVYTVSQALVLGAKDRIKIFGHGATISTTANVSVFDVSGATNLEICGLRFLGSYSGADTPANQEAITANPGGAKLDIHDCVFDTITVGVFVAGTGWADVSIHHNKFLSTNAAVATGTGTGTNLKIQDNEFIDSFTLSSDDSIAVSGQVSGVIIAGNYINKNANGSVLRAHGILLNPAQGTGISHAVIANNVILNNTTSGTNPRAAIEADDPVGGRLNSILIADNILAGDYSGIAITPLTTDTIVLRGNIISSPTAYGIDGNAANATGAIIVADNVVFGPGSDGIYVALSANLIALGNQVSGGAARGIVVDTCANAVVSSNRAWGNTSTNILINASTGAVAATNYPTPVVQ